MLFNRFEFVLWNRFTDVIEFCERMYLNWFDSCDCSRYGLFFKTFRNQYFSRCNHVKRDTLEFEQIVLRFRNGTSILKLSVVKLNLNWVYTTSLFSNQFYLKLNLRETSEHQILHKLKLVFLKFFLILLNIEFWPFTFLFLIPLLVSFPTLHSVLK